jgi:hypothetical protein
MLLDYSQLPAAQSGLTTTETVAIISQLDPMVQVSQGAQGRVITGMLNVTGAATAGTIALKCRHAVTTDVPGTTSPTGTQVGLTQTSNLASSASESIPFTFQDNAQAAPAVGQANVYEITVTFSVTAGAVNDGNIAVEVPTPLGASS